jgi:DNA-binding NtrC family response regulator
MSTDGQHPRALLADDQRDVLEALRLLLKGEGFEIRTATAPDEIVEQISDQDFDVLLMDLNYTRDTTSGREGIDLLERIRKLDPALPVVVMTAWASVELAVEAMRRGARDFVEKPWDNHRLLSILRTQTELGRALKKGQRLEAENRMLRAEAEPSFIAESRAMQPVLELIARVGPSAANVLITGENGTGKSIVARRLHTVSDRTSSPMVTVNTGGLSESIFESELFGHVKGAYTDAKSDRVGRFEMADGGTLFLDEISNISAKQQAKLLRVLETGEFERLGSSRTRKVDVRVLSATNADLQAEVDESRFRQDLLFRLKTVEIHLPPLRERTEDIPPLAAHFLERHNHRYRKEVEGFSDEALHALRTYAWPGNVRELDHAVERGVLMTTESRIGPADLALGPVGSDGRRNLEEMPLDDVERFLIQRALERSEGNVSSAAQALGLSRSALYRRLEKYDI